MELLLQSAPGAAITGLGLVGVLPGLPWPVPLAIVGAVVFGVSVGDLVERLLIRPLEGRPDISVVNFTIGLLIAVNALTVEFWARRLAASPSRSRLILAISPGSEGLGRATSRSAPG